MKKIFTIILVLYSTLNCIAQSKKETQKRIDEINSLLTVYDTLNPFSEYYSYDLMDSVSSKIQARLIEVLAHPKIQSYDLSKTFKEAQGVFISISEDKKLGFFSIRLKTGGSDQEALALTYYLGENGENIVEDLGDETYALIASLGTTKKHYLVSSERRTCTTCCRNSIELVSIDSTIHFESLVSYEGRCVFEYHFDNESQSLTYSYLSPDYDDPIYSNSEDTDASVYLIKGTFKYLDEAFIETENCKTIYSK